jgi:hypothetical protein
MAGDCCNNAATRSIYTIAVPCNTVALIVAILLVSGSNASLHGYKDWESSGKKLQTLYQNVNTKKIFEWNDKDPVYPVFDMQLSGSFTPQEQKHVYAAASLVSLYLLGTNTSVDAHVTIVGVDAPSPQHDYASIVLATTFDDNTIEVYTPTLDSASAGLIMVIFHELLHAFGFNYHVLMEKSLLDCMFRCRYNGSTVTALTSNTKKSLFVESNHHWSDDTFFSSGEASDIMHAGLHAETRLSVETLAVIKDVQPSWDVVACNTDNDCSVLTPMYPHCQRFHADYPGRCRRTLAPVLFTEHTTFIVNVLAFVLSGGVWWLRNAKYN